MKNYKKDPAQLVVFEQEKVIMTSLYKQKAKEKIFGNMKSYRNHYDVQELLA